MKKEFRRKLSNFKSNKSNVIRFLIYSILFYQLTILCEHTDRIQTDRFRNRQNTKRQNTNRQIQKQTEYKEKEDKETEYKQTDKLIERIDGIDKRYRLTN